VNREVTAGPRMASPVRHQTIALAWQAALTGLGPLLDRADEYRHLLALVDRIAAALVADPVDRAAARVAGAALGALHYSQPEALCRTQEFLDAQLLAGIGEDQRRAAQPRLATVLAEFSAGVFQQTRDTVLAEQEAIRSALLLQQRQAEAARRESAARFRAIFEHAAISIALAGTDGRLIDTNPAMQKLLGYQRAELQGRTFMEFAHADDLKADWHLFQDLASGKREYYEAEERYYRRDGSIVWGHMTVSMVRDATGQPQFLLAMGENITERKYAEAELARQLHEAKAARSETRAILDATGEAMLLIADDGRVLTANRQCEAFFGLAQQTLGGQNVAGLRPAFQRIFGDPAIIDSLAARIADGDGRFRQDLVQQWPERRELEVSSTAVPETDGRLLGRLFAFRDVTRERAVDRMKSEFVALVSHELRTPLTSIKGYVDLLIAGEVGELDPQQREFLGIVSSNADRLVALIGNLLDISRMESGKVEITRAPIDLLRLLTTCAATFRPQIEQKRQRLTLEGDAVLPPVSGDADRVLQIITNLVSNAHKYTPLGGHITVTARHEGTMVRVSVRDTGVGMSAEEQAQLFTRFFRGKGRAAQDAGGTGLGLVIVRSLVDLHGGELRVTSAPGEGTTITFTLPVIAGEELPAFHAPRVSAGGRVLVVDDEPDIAQLFARYLDRAGYRVQLAASATEALRLARAEQPDLIILDLLLPQTDGFTALEWLKLDPSTAAIPVLLLSILEDDGRGRLLGAVDYLTKPVQEPTLLAHVARALTAERSSPTR
jgi:PAS domain S-box-containing protein